MDKLKYIAAALLLFMVSFVGGCVGADAKTAEAYEYPNTYKGDRIVKVESANTNMTIWKDNVTGVHYLVYEEENKSTTNAGRGVGLGAAICVMVDAEGKPLVDKGE